MSIQRKIETLIDQNNWRIVENYLKDQNGCIGPLGGRYSYAPFSGMDGCSDINQICWRIFKASDSDAFKQMPWDELAAASSVIKELRRLYDETQTALAHVPCGAWIATRTYDFREKITDGLQPIERLESEVLPELEAQDPSLRV